MNDESRKFGGNLKRLRTKKGLSQGEIARRLGVDKGFVCNVENGKTNPTLVTITKLAKAIDVSASELLE